MSQSQSDRTAELKKLMQQADIPSFKALSLQAKVSQKVLKKLRQGEVERIPVVTWLRLSRTLDTSPLHLLAVFAPEISADLPVLPQEDVGKDIDNDLRQEYRHLQMQMAQQRETLWQEFQQTSLQTLETWLTTWQTIAAKIQQDANFDARKVLPIVRPVENLMREWGVEAIARVGDRLSYDPKLHQLLKETAEPGQLVEVLYTGYHHGDRLLHRAKVKPVNPEPVDPENDAPFG